MFYFIQNKQKLEDCRTSEIEYEVFADTFIIGGYEDDAYRFMMWDFPITKLSEGENRKLCLRIRTREKLYSDDEKPWETATKEGYYHRGGVADEIVCFSSLFLRRRLKLGREVRRNNTPCRNIGRAGWIDKHLIRGESNLSELTQWFIFLETLGTQFHQKFILAARFYQQALFLVEESPELAYLNLVSSIESLCQEYDIEKPPISEIDQKLDSFLEKIDDENLRNEIKNRILKREKFIGRRFVKFIIDHIEEDFWNDEERKRVEIGKIERGQLPELLKRVYNQRSTTLHTGEPFPPQISGPPSMGSDIDFSLGISSGDRKWEPKDYVPNIHFFEGLVNHVLKVYLKRNQIKE